MSIYIFKKLQTQDIHFTPVSSPGATDTKFDLPVRMPTVTGNAYHCIGQDSATAKYGYRKKFDGI